MLIVCLKSWLAFIFLNKKYAPKMPTSSASKTPLKIFFASGCRVQAILRHVLVGLLGPAVDMKRIGCGEDATVKPTEESIVNDGYGSIVGELTVLFRGGRMVWVMFHEGGDLDLEEQIGVCQTRLSRRNSFR